MDVGPLGVGLHNSTPCSCLEIEARAQIRARTQFANRGRIFASSTLAQHPAKITTRRKIPLGTSGYRDRGSIANIDSHPTAKMADSDSPVTLRTRKFIRNPLLGRKQMVV